MKLFLINLFLLLGYVSVNAQADFTGIANYVITTEGNDTPTRDSMTVIFTPQKVKVILYLPNSKDSSLISEKFFIDDFANKKSIVADSETKTYKVDSLNNDSAYSFRNTFKVSVANDNSLCFEYDADANKLDTANVKGAYCFASIDNRNSFMSNYFFLGVQPLIIDNRIVMDFIVKQSDGTKPRIYISSLKKSDNVESYFKMDGYTQVHQ